MTDIYPLMLNHFARYFTGFSDKPRVTAVNDHLLYDSLPVLPVANVLYLDGEGTASAYIAKRGAEIYLSGEFNTVVIAGSRTLTDDWKSKITFPMLQKDELSLPVNSETEAEYIARLFWQEFPSEAEIAKDSSLKHAPDLHLFGGKNTGEKIRNCREFFESAATIQAVTLSYNQRRLHGTMRKEIGQEPVISVDGVYPLGFTKENWDKHFLSYAVVMSEADKTGPVAQGKKPAYRKFFDDVDIGLERNRIELAL